MRSNPGLEYAARKEFDLTTDCKVWCQSRNSLMLVSEARLDTGQTLLEAGMKNGQVNNSSLVNILN